MTLEEIDFLFTKDGNTGLKKFTRRSQPVQESLKPVEEIARDKDLEKGTSLFASGEHVDHIDKIEEKDQP